jgi:hypothetical protein
VVDCATLSAMWRHRPPTAAVDLGDGRTNGIERFLTEISPALTSRYGT